jgi:hypothetical protein
VSPFARIAASIVVRGTAWQLHTSSSPLAVCAVSAPDRLAELLARHPAWHADPVDAELVAGLLPAAAASTVRRTAEPWDRDAMAARIAAVLHPPAFAG